MQTITLKPNPPYDFAWMPKRLEKAKDDLFHAENGTLSRTLRIGERVVLVRISSEGEADNPRLRADLLYQDTKLTPLVLKKLEARLSHMLSVDTDLEAFYGHIRAIPGLALLEQRYNGMRMLLDPDPFECMVRTIIGQQLNLAFAATLTRRLVQLASPEPLVHEGRTFLIFPNPDEVARLSYESLCELQFSRRKAEYVIDFAREIAEGNLDMERLEEMNNEEIISQMVRMRGIGRWTVECFLLFGLGRTDLLPAADIGLRNGLKRWFGLDSQPTEEEVRRWGASWSPWSSYVTYYLWESLNG